MTSLLNKTQAERLNIFQPFSVFWSNKMNEEKKNEKKIKLAITKLPDTNLPIPEPDLLTDFTNKIVKSAEKDKEDWQKSESANPISEESPEGNIGSGVQSDYQVVSNPRGIGKVSETIRLMLIRKEVEIIEIFMKFCDENGIDIFANFTPDARETLVDRFRDYLQEHRKLRRGSMERLNWYETPMFRDPVSLKEGETDD